MTSFGDGLTSDLMAPATSSTQVVENSEEVVDTMITSLTTAPSTQPFPLAAFAMEQEVAPSPRAKMAADLWKKQETTNLTKVIVTRHQQPLPWIRVANGQVQEALNLDVGPGNDIVVGDGDAG
uniref:Uncharacterized protein n=1 Tax=Oryza glumipatula TaxID=40148 RepID=A0A0E0A5A9_9ORYZ